MKELNNGRQEEREKERERKKERERERVCESEIDIVEKREKQNVRQGDEGQER